MYTKLPNATDTGYRLLRLWVNMSATTDPRTRSQDLRRLHSFRGNAAPKPRRFELVHRRFTRHRKSTAGLLRGVATCCVCTASNLNQQKLSRFPSDDGGLPVATEPTFELCRRLKAAYFHFHFHVTAQWQLENCLWCNALSIYQ